MKRRSRRLLVPILVGCLTAQPSPAAQTAPPAPEEFSDVKWVQKSGETEVILWFEGDRFVLRSPKKDRDLHAVSYRFINGAAYSYSKSPRWKTTAGAAVVLGPLALPLLFAKGRRHWLTIRAGADTAVLHLDKGNYKAILPAFEAHTGIKVETVADKK